MSSMEDSGFGSLAVTQETRVMSTIDLQRMERKIDKLADAVSKLVVVEERQANQNLAIVELRGLIETNRKANELTDRKVDQWVNRGVGVWGVAIVIFSIIELFLRK